MIRDLSINKKLHMYVELNDIQRVKWCLKNGANPNTFDSNSGYTTLITALNNRNFELFDLLLDNGADPTIEIAGYNIFHHLYNFIKDEANSPSSLELEIWILKKDFQYKLIDKNNKMYFILKEHNFLVPETYEKYSYLEAASDLNLL